VRGSNRPARDEPAPNNSSAIPSLLRRDLGIAQPDHAVIHVALRVFEHLWVCVVNSVVHKETLVKTVFRLAGGYRVRVVTRPNGIVTITIEPP